MIDQKQKENQAEDFEAVRKVLAGDTSAFSVLQNKYTGIISSLIRRMVRNSEDVADLTQDTFIKAFRALNTFQFGYSFSAWIYRIASNNCIDFLRKKRFTTVSLNRTVANSDDEYVIEIEDSTYRPDLDVLSDERKAYLREAIDNLPENYRVIIKMRHEEELEYKEIAEKLDMPLGTVKAHLFRARKILFSRLKKEKHLFIEH